MKENYKLNKKDNKWNIYEKTTKGWIIKRPVF